MFHQCNPAQLSITLSITTHKRVSQLGQVLSVSLVAPLMIILFLASILLHSIIAKADTAYSSVAVSVTERKVASICKRQFSLAKVRFSAPCAPVGLVW